MMRRHGGASLNDHFASVARQTGKKMPEPPALPPEVRHLWHTFLELHRTRPSSGFGPSAITFVEMDAWQRLMRMPLEVWEVGAIRQLDDVWIESTAESGATVTEAARPT